jgi:hypothetical protein
MSKYNGHKNFNHWNVSLWINNDESLYLTAKRYVRIYGKGEGAIKLFNDYFEGTSTPDDVKYTLSSVRAALVGI